VIVHLLPAYPHKSEGRPGADSGTCWVQEVLLISIPFCSPTHFIFLFRIRSVTSVPFVSRFPELLTPMCKLSSDTGLRGEGRSLERIFGRVALIASSIHVRIVIRAILRVVAAAYGVLLCGAAPDSWPRFRGPNGQGINDDAKPPIHFGPKLNNVWQADILPGHSSPCVWGDRLFLTGYDRSDLQLICFNAPDGSERWRRQIPLSPGPTLHQENSPAAATPVTDGRRVAVLFGGDHLVCYDLDGTRLWGKELPPSTCFNGAATSPILADGRLVLTCDGERRSYIIALDIESGETLWKTSRTRFSSGFGTPIILTRGDKRQEVLVPGSIWLAAYDLADGRERWSSPGYVSYMVAPSPVLAGDLVIGMSLPESKQVFDSWPKMLERFDENKDGKLVIAEIKSSNPKDAEDIQMFHDALTMLDRNNDGIFDGVEYDVLRQAASPSYASLFAVRIPDTSTRTSHPEPVWSYRRGLARVASPLVYQNRIYIVADGGMVTCLQAATGHPIFEQERLGAEGAYYASPVAADGKIFFASRRGMVSVIAARDSLQVLAQNNLGETLTATPALVGPRIYVRTEKHVWAFGK
jgi:outer membrane protein assembly factor BamB